MKLLVVESPAKAKTISKYLDGEYTVTSSVGHIRDLPKNNKAAIDIEGGFIPRYEISPGKEKVVKELQKLCGEADEVMLATDPDREGEAIAWHIAQVCDLGNPKSEIPNPKLKRIVFHEITKPAVQEAMGHPRDIDENLRRAQEARRILDRLVGYDLSGLIWKKLRYGLSAGRVQSPALRIIMEREREIRAFKPEDFWVITALTETQSKNNLPLICSVEPRNKKEVEHILSVSKGGAWKVKEIKETQMKRSARAPFTTSTLQQAASSQLGFAPSWTMRTAQRLYEAGHITYMRTDSTNISTTAQQQALSVIEKTYGADYAEAHFYKTKSKNAQEAHEAIRPTNASVKSAGATDEQKKLYGLIWRRFISSQMKDAQLLKTKITVSINDDEVPDFAANGSRTIFDGWLLADSTAKGENVELPKASKGEMLTLIEVKDEQKQTQPPSRYTEAGLIKELEKRGIGRPSTYASIMKTIADRGYVTKEGKTLFPTDTGEVVSDFLEKNFADYISDTFTAEMENKLDEIAGGTREYEKTLADFYTPFSKDVKSKEHIQKITDLGDAPKEFKCPKCDSTMIIKLGRGGKFMSCARFPDCDGARTIEGFELKPDEPIGVDSKTGENIYLLSGRFGPYVQLGQKTKENPKPRRASVPKTMDLAKITTTDALKFLSIPRELGVHPETGKTITASIGRFGPYIVHDKDFRSLKTDDVYTIELPRALEILAEEKKTRKRKTK
ncbi:MAG: type I DNA topoisomerase [Parcubacteria group bacterium]|nr:type I DNA topoisomerase [Parcubacteria group bacterium]